MMSNAEHHKQIGVLSRCRVNQELISLRHHVLLNGVMF